MVMYFLDFVICLIVLRLFFTYAKKSREDEEKLKQYYLMGLNQDGYEGEIEAVQEPDSAIPKQQIGRGNGLAALANKFRRDLDAESFLAVQNE